jgi:hypothetical protein
MDPCNFVQGDKVGAQVDDGGVAEVTVVGKYGSQASVRRWQLWGSAKVKTGAFYRNKAPFIANFQSATRGFNPLW